LAATSTSPSMNTERGMTQSRRAGGDAESAACNRQGNTGRHVDYESRHPLQDLIHLRRCAAIPVHHRRRTHPCTSHRSNIAVFSVVNTSCSAAAIPNANSLWIAPRHQMRLVLCTIPPTRLMIPRPDPLLSGRHRLLRFGSPTTCVLPPQSTRRRTASTLSIILPGPRRRTAMDACSRRRHSNGAPP